MGSLFEIGGLISGMDTASLIDGILSIQQRPILQLERKKDEIDRKAEAVAAVGSRVSDLKSLITSLKLRSNINSKSVFMSQPSDSTALLTATASADAANGVHKVTIKNLATATTVQSDGLIGQAVDATASVTGTTVGSSGSGLRTAVTAGTFTIHGPSGNATITIADGDTLNDVVGDINAETGTTGVTAALVNDSESRSNLLQLSVAAGTVTVGSGDDTSTFLEVMNLTGANQSGTTLTSTHNIGVVQTSADLQDARLKTSLSASTGTFKVNGVEFSYDATSDSLNDVIGRINSSSAGVNMAYDSMQDELVLRSKTTGAETVALEDVSGNFLAAVDVLNATQSLGENAVFAIDTVNNGADITSASNTITDVIPGVTLTLQQEDASNQVTVTISQDVGTATGLIQGFVAQVNSLLQYIADQTAYDADEDEAAILLGDSAVTLLASSIRRTVLGHGEGLTGQYTSLQDLGLSTGSVGSAVGTAGTIEVDTSDLSEALSTNPDAVADLMTARETAASLVSGGTGNIPSISGSPSVRKEAGTYKLEIESITGDPSSDPQTATLTFTPDDGGTDIVKTVTVTPGETNTELIPGMSIQMAATLAVGSDDISVTVPVRGIAQILDDYLAGLLSSTGMFEAREEAAADEIRDVDARIIRLEARLVEQRERLVRRFASLEATLARLQGQQSFLSSQVTAWAGLSGG